MRGIEAEAIASGQVSGLELMERAGRGVVQAILDEWRELALARGGGAAQSIKDGGAAPAPPGYLGQEEMRAPRAMVLCGPGNNGGDGFVVARLLAERGWSVRVLAAAKADVLPRDAAINAWRWFAYGPVEPLTEAALRSGPASDLYVDAIFGTGLTRPPEGEVARVLSHIGGRNGDNAYYTPRLVAIDAPSVLCLDSGRSLLRAGGYLPRARLTVTFDSLKVGHVLAEGPALCGRVAVVDIGIEPWRRMTKLRRGPSRQWMGAVKRVGLGLVGPGDEGEPFALMHPGSFRAKMLSKAGWVEDHKAHKFSHGHALVLGGGAGRGGAARLAARGALRVGAGLVTLGCPPDAFAENAARLDAVMLREMADAAALARVLADRRITALCLGPGMGTGLRERRLVAAALGLDAERPPPLTPPHKGEGSRKTAGVLATAKVRVPRLPLVGRGRGWGARQMVLDADALAILSQRADLFAALHPDCVLTPHAGEFARLFPDIAAKLEEPATKGPAYSKVDATREAAARAGCVVLFKGPDTVIADQKGRCAINSAHDDRAAPWLATAGSGDVLAGFIAGLMARGFAPFDAACTGAWLHVECALSFGPGLIAEDLPEELPAAFRALGL